MGLGNTLSSRSENEYRRVKLKYGRQKLKRMGLNPAKYSEDFIFALKITLDEVNVDIKAAAKLVDTNYSPSITGVNSADHMVDLQIKDNYRSIAGTSKKTNSDGTTIQAAEAPNWDIGGVDSRGGSDTGKLFIETTTAQLDLHKLLVFIRYQPLDDGSDESEARLSFYEATTLYSDPVNLLFICMWRPSQPGQTFSPIGQFPLIHGFAEKCQQKSGSSPPAGTSPSDQHQATHATSTCLDQNDVTTNQDIAIKLRNNTSTDPNDYKGEIRGTDYEGGSPYITRYANIVKLITGDGGGSNFGVPTLPTQADQFTFSGKSIPNKAYVTQKNTLVATDFDNIGWAAASQGSQASTPNPFKLLTKSALETRINELMTITGIMTKTGLGNENNITGKRLGCILAEIDIHSMSEVFTLSNMDVVFELISKGV